MTEVTSMQKVKVRGQKVKVTVTEVKTQLSRFPDHNSSFNSHMISVAVNYRYRRYKNFDR